MKALRQILPVIAAIIMAAVVATGAPRKKTQPQPWAKGADQRKADLYFMEAQRQNLLDNDDAFFDLMSQAYQLDTTDTGVAQLLGYYMLALGQNDTTYARKGFEMMGRRFEQNPADYYSSVFYGMINDRLGNVGESNRIWKKLHQLNPGNSDVALKYAEALMAAGDSLSLREAVDVLDGIERVEGFDVGITSHKVRSLLQLNDSATALKQLRDFRAASPRNPNIMIYSGDVFNALSMPDSAIYYYDKACEVDSAYGLAYYKRAKYYAQRGDSAAYAREIRQALGQESLDIGVKAELLKTYTLDIYNDTAPTAEIDTLFEEVVARHPHEGAIRDLYSSYLVARRQFAKAAEQQEFALDANPSDSTKWIAVVSLYSQAHDTAKSMATASQALAYFPGNMVLNLLQGGNYQLSGDFNTALKYFNTALHILESSPDEQTNHEAKSQVLAAIGDSYHSLAQTDSAFAYYERALKENPRNAMALNNFAYYMTLSGNPDKLPLAEEYSARSLAAQPDNDTFLDTYAWVLYNMKKYSEAKEYIDQALELEADDPQADVLDHAGDIYYMNGDPARALELWQQALTLDPDNPLLKKKVTHKTHFFR